jgi:hypothetical protein
VGPWLITTFGWPVLTAHFAGATARLVVHPVMAGAVAAGAFALAAGTLLMLRRGRARQARPHGRST